MSSVETSSLSSSLTDMMTSLMVIFVLLLVVFLNEKAGEAEQAQSKTDAMLEMLAKAFTEASIPLNVEKIDNYNLVVIVPEGRLGFAEGRWDLNDQAEHFLAVFTPILLGAYSRFFEDVALVNIEGHTSRTQNKNPHNKYWNWDLSQNRAGAVRKFIFDNGDPMIVQDFKKIALFGGRGPVECSAPDEFQDNCRTVKFKIRMRSGEEKEALKAAVIEGFNSKEEILRP